MTRIIKEADERRNEILDAAETLITEKGYSKTTIIDILNQVGIAKGTFYYYFKSKYSAVMFINMNTKQASTKKCQQLSDV